MAKKSKALAKRYCAVIAMWGERFDTCEIAQHLKLPEATVAKWIANYRDISVGFAA